MIQEDQGVPEAYPWQTSPRTMDSPLCQNSIQDHFLSVRCTGWHKALAGGFADANVPTAALAESVSLQRSRGTLAAGSMGCLVHILRREKGFSCVGSGHLRSALIFLVFLGTADLNLIAPSNA